MSSSFFIRILWPRSAELWGYPRLGQRAPVGAIVNMKSGPESPLPGWRCIPQRPVQVKPVCRLQPGARNPAGQRQTQRIIQVGIHDVKPGKQRPIQRLPCRG